MAPRRQNGKALPYLGEYGKALPYLKPHAPSLALIIAISVVSTGTGLLTPLVNQQLIDHGLIGRNINILWLTAAATVLLTVFGFITNALSSFLYLRVSTAVLFAMRLSLYRHLQMISPRYHARSRMGDFISRLNNDVAEVQRVSADAMLAVLANAVFLVGAVILMIRISPILFLCSILLLPPAIYFSNKAQTKLAMHARILRERSASIGSFLIESLLGLRLTVLSNAQDREVSRFAQENQTFVDALRKQQITGFMAGAIPATAVMLSTAIVFLAGGYQVFAGAITLGALIAFLAYHGRLLAPVQNLMSLYGSLVTGAVSLRRMFEVLEIPIEVQEPVNPIILQNWTGELTFQDVTFSYSDQPVLNGVSFHLVPGETYLLTGASGAGKSTIADLAVRLCDPSSGTIRLDGHDLRTIALAELRHRIAVVEQTPILFHGTAAENIAYSRPDATEQEVEEAARAAAFSLPLHTQVGERGCALSAGERQRIAIARALLRDPAVLILDEPVSALDSVASKAVAATLKRILQTRTGLIVTHDPAAFEGQVLQLVDGRIETHACTSA